MKQWEHIIYLDISFIIYYPPYIIHIITGIPWVCLIMCPLPTWSFSVDHDDKNLMIYSTASDPAGGNACFFHIQNSCLKKKHVQNSCWVRMHVRNSCWVKTHDRNSCWVKMHDRNCLEVFACFGGRRLDWKSGGTIRGFLDVGSRKGRKIHVLCMFLYFSHAFGHQTSNNSNFLQVFAGFRWLEGKTAK